MNSGSASASRRPVQTRAVEYRTQWGQLILRDPRGLHAGMPWPHYSIHRGHLHRILLDTVTAELPAGSVVTDHRVEGFEHAPRGGAEVRMRRGDGSAVQMHADILVGADGIHSSRATAPRAPKPCCSWRASG